MEYLINCPAGVDTLTDSSVVCLADLGNSVTVYAGLSESDVTGLLSMSLAIFAAAWGFRMIGQLIFKHY